MDGVSDWQHPFVDVFKRYNTFEAPRSYKGNVQIIHDPIIARKCFKLSGSILSNNSVTIPDPSTEVKHCNLIGRYIYVEFFASPEKLFCIHFEIGIKDREPGVRLTFTNMEKEYSVVGGNTLKVPFQYPEGKNFWTVACIDIEHHLENFGLFSKGVIKNYSGVHTLRGIQICSNQNVRGIYTSSNVYDWDSLPKQMCFKMVKGGRWSEFYNFCYFPQSIDPSQLRKKMKEQNQSMVQFPKNIVQREQNTQRKKKYEPQFIRPPKKIHSELQSQPLIQLSTIFSFSSLYNPDILFKNQFVYYSAGSIMVRKNINTGEEMFMQGHTDYIVALDAHEDWIVTVQNGSKPSVKIWIDNKCISSFQCPYEKVQQVRLSHKKHLALVGLDSKKSQSVLVFDISEIEITRRPVLLAKQMSDFSILTLKFSPTQTDKLVSCGKQNIRFWRVKNQRLAGAPVILNHHARNTIFTVFDFEYCFDDPNPLKQKSQIRHVYVGSQNGLLFQVNYQTHQLQQVYKLHDNAAITSLVVSAGFCITGSQDQMLRVWQLDFSENTIEIKNDGVVTSLMLSDDASLLACGTSKGTLAILDLADNKYKIKVRSHTSNVSQIVYHGYSNSMITLSADLTIRLWDPEQLEEIYQFNYLPNDICTCISGNPNALQFASGFKSGMLRIFDIQNTCLSCEINHHENPIIFIEYSPDGSFLAVLEQNLNMLYSPLHSHQPVKHLPVEIPSKYKHSAFSEDSEQLALIGDSGTHVNIWELRSLQMIGKIFTGKIIKKLKYQSDKVWTIFEDTSIRRYNVSDMVIEVEMQALHRQSLNSIAYNLQDHLLYSVGDDSFVKVWDYSFLRQPHQVCIGHANTINDMIYKDGKLWTVGSEGLFVWETKKPLEEFIPPPVQRRQKKATFIKNGHYEQKILEQPREEVEELTETLREEKPVKIMFSTLMKQTAGNEEMQSFVPQKIDMNFAPKTTTMKKIKKRQPKPALTTKTTANNQLHNLPLKHFFQEDIKPNQLQYPKKIEMIKQSHKKLKLEYLMALEPYAHDHVVWNFMYGWYAYVYDNLIIVESLAKVRSQRIITMPEKIGSMLLTKDFKRLICVGQFNGAKKDKQEMSGSEEGSVADSSDGGQAAEKQTAGIYVIGPELTVERKLQFHPKGVQSIALNSSNKFLISLGNFRECTVCVWDFPAGKLKASSYTLDKVNDVAIMEGCGEGRVLQFATVGRDQIHFWAYTKEEKLEYYDVFIQKDESDNDIPELTSCAYFTHDDSHYLMCGTVTGELLLVKYGEFEVTWRKKICSGEIINIKCYASRAVIGSADGCLYFWHYSTHILQGQPTPSFNKINLYYSVNGLFFDEDGSEGIVSTTQAIYYVNLQEQMHSLLIGSSPDHVLLSKVISGQYLLTSHQNGRLKLWNLDTAEQLKTYKWKYPCTEAYFDESLNKIVCFCKNQSIKLVNIKKFTKQESYLPEELAKAVEPRLDDWILNHSVVQYGGKYGKWVFSKKGNVYDFHIGLDGKKKVIQLEKVLEIGELYDVGVYSDKNLLLGISSAGDVSAYNVDMELNKQFSLLLVDKCPISEFYLERRNKSSDEEYNPGKMVKTVVSKVMNETYLAISEESRYVYFRNYMKRITFQKISLTGIPTSIMIREYKKESETFVGLRQGSIVCFNTLDPEHRIRYQSVVNDSVEYMGTLKNRNSIIATYPNAITLLTSQ